MNRVWSQRLSASWYVRLLGMSLVGFALTCAALPGFAEPDPAKANTLFKAAKVKLEAGDAHGALSLVSRAADYFGHPAIFLLKAKTLLSLGRYQKALEALESISTRKLPAPFKKTRAEGIKEAKAAMATHGHLVLTLQPPAAVAVIDGKRYALGVDTWLPAGAHEIKVEAQGFVTETKRVQLGVGDRADVTIALKPAAGTLRVQVSGGLKGVELELDGKPWPVGEGKRAGDIVSKRLGVGEHEVSCRRGSLLESHKVRVALNKTVAVGCTQIGGGPSRVAVLSVGWGGVAAGLALAGYGAWGLQGYFADLDYAEKNGLIADTNKHYGGALYLASGLAIGVSSYLLLVRDSKPDAGATALAPVADAPWHASAR